MRNATVFETAPCADRPDVCRRVAWKVGVDVCRFPLDLRRRFRVRLARSTCVRVAIGPGKFQRRCLDMNWWIPF